MENKEYTDEEIKKEMDRLVEDGLFSYVITEKGELHYQLTDKGREETERLEKN